MTPERWQAIGDLFERASVLPPGDQTAFVEAECRGDEEMRVEIASLLASHRAAAGGFLQDRIKGALTAFFDTSVASGARVGPYRLIRELGRGGMGTVFLAERDDDEYRARVAVKLVRPGMDTEFILARFRRERQTLARLQHPNISRLLDGGTTATGLPYIVMEYIEGEWLTEFADRRALGIADRLRLFLDVCSAVDYAHRQFIIHRDLKPGNILVNADGAAKLLDFGICKLLRSDPVPGHETVVAPLTPNYASPEQVRGEAITLLSDVYSLGAVLYELLTGTPPRRFESLTPRAIEDAIEKPIVRPSAAARSKAAARRLAGDLDNVLMRALETDSARRYESAAQLADDVRRYLDQEPVRARPQTVAYRMRKFVRRHHVHVVAAALVLLTLTAGLAVSMYESRIADERLQQVRRMADRLVFDVHDAVGELPGSTQARQVIAQTALEFLDASANALQGDARGATELARAYRRLGDVQGGVQGSNLGDTAGALDRYTRAVTLLDAALRRAPRDEEAAVERLVLYDRVGQHHAYNGKLQDAVATLQQGIQFGTSFRASRNAALRTALADVYLQSGDAKRNLTNYESALRDSSEGLRLYQEIVTAGSAPDVRNRLATAYAAVGMAEARINHVAEALTNFRLGAGEMETLVTSNPRNVSWNRDLMMAYGHIADALGNPDLANLGDRGGALDAYRKAAAIARRLHEADRADQRAATDYGIVLSRVETTMDDGDAIAKIPVQQESLRVLDEAARRAPNNTALKIYLSLVNQHLGDSSQAAGDLEGAQRAYQTSVAIAEASVPSGHVVLINLFIQSNQKLAFNAIARGRRAEALAHARRGLDVGRENSTNGAAMRVLPRALSAMGLTYTALVRSPLRQAGDRDEAVAYLEQAADAWHASQAAPGFAAPHQREMHDVEETLARLRQDK